MHCIYIGGRKAKGVIFLNTATTLAAEAYVFHSLMTVLPESAFTCGRVGGWTQTKLDNLTEARTNQLCEEWRMAHARCVRCGGKCPIGRCMCIQIAATTCSAVSKVSTQVASSLSSSTSTAVPKPSRKPCPKMTLAPPRVVPTEPTDDELFDAWFEQASLFPV